MKSMSRLVLLALALLTFNVAFAQFGGGPGGFGGGPGGMRPGGPGGMRPSARDRQQGMGILEEDDSKKIGSVTGTVINILDQKPVEYATVSVVESQSGKVVTGGITNFKGVFNVKQIPAGEFKVVVSYIGYEEYTAGPITISNKNRNVDLSTIYLEEKIEALGIVGVLIMLFIQILQVFVAFIPGEPVEILMGVMYGTVGGLLLSLLGCAIGSSLVFLAMRKFGQPLFEFFFEKKQLDRFAFLKNSKKLELFTFILFLIPGTPKDLLTYFAPLTSIDFKIFLIITIFARIPSIITSTYAGSSILEGNIIKTVLIFGATAIIGITGIIVGNKISDKQNKENKS